MIAGCLLLIVDCRFVQSLWKIRCLDDCLLFVAYCDFFAVDWLLLFMTCFLLLVVVCCWLLFIVDIVAIVG